MGRSVLDYMPQAQADDVCVYGYNYDVTAALQAAIDDMLMSSGALDWPDGGYKITAPLSIPATSGWKMSGMSRLGTVVKQFTDNEPIFRFDAENTHSFKVSDFRLDWANPQPIANTGAIGVYFAGPASPTGAGMYNFELSRLTFSNGCRGIVSNPASKVTVWGGDFNNLFFYQTNSGAAIRLRPNPSAGVPNNSFRNVYIRADSIDSSEPGIIDLGAADGAELHNIEFNLINNGVPALRLSGGSNVSAGQIKVEGATYASSGAKVFDIADTYGKFDKIQVLNATFNPGSGNKVYIIGVSGAGAILKIGLVNVSATVSSGSVFLLNGGGSSSFRYDIDDVEQLVNVSLTDVASSTTADSTYVRSWARPKKSTDKGDADYSVSIGDSTTILYATQLTADRSLTLPTGNVFGGLRYRIVRPASGSFNLNVKSGSTTLKALAAATWAEVEYHRDAWTVIGAGSLQ